jgi:4'-phosphopantetheinyl transferase EntD
MHNISDLLLSEHNDAIEFFKNTSKFAFRSNSPFVNKHIFEWIFKYNNSKKITINDKIVGIFFLNKFKSKYNNELYPCNECSMLCVENNLGMKLIKDTLKDASALSLGINRETFYPICKVLKYTYDDMNRHVLLLKESTYHLSEYFNLNKELSKDIFCHYLYNLNNTETTLTPISNINSCELSNVFNNFINKHSFLSINKTDEYFQWRYLECPFFNYKIFGDNISGFIICRIEKINLPDFQNYNVMRIIELFYEDSVKFENLLNKFINYCVKKNCILIDFYFSNDFYSSMLEKYNFIKNPSFIPYLFKDHNPSNIKNLNFAYYPKFGENTDNLYIVKSNVDQDFIYVYDDKKIQITQMQQEIFNQLSGNYNHWKNNNSYVNFILLILNNVFEELFLFDVHLHNIKINYFNNIKLNLEYNLKYRQKGNILEIFLTENEKDIISILVEYNYINNQNILSKQNDIYSKKEPTSLTFDKIEAFYKSKCKISYEQTICNNLLVQLYPFLANNLNLNQIIVLLFLSRSTGMEIPGKYSLIKKIDLFFNKEKDIGNSNNLGLFISNLENTTVKLNLDLKNTVGEIICSYDCNINNKNNNNNSTIVIGNNCKIIIDKFLFENINKGKLIYNQFTPLIKEITVFNGKEFSISDNLMLCDSYIIITELCNNNNLLLKSNSNKYILQEEIEYGLKYKKHIDQFIGGRIALRYALSKYSSKNNFVIPPILNDEYGALIVPKWCKGTISHKDNISLAVATNNNNCYIGVDIEYIHNKSYELIALNILTRNELSILGKLSNMSRENEILLIFSFKESLYKAINNMFEKTIDFKEVDVRILTNGTANIKCILNSKTKFKINASWMKFKNKYWITFVNCTI